MLSLLGVYRYRDAVFFASFGFALFANFFSVLLAGLSILASLKDRCFLDSLIYFAFTLLSIVPMGLVIYLLAKVNFLMNPG